ncbi:MAG: gamma-glutamyl-gamma-aminobutyrate hydrolase family protein [Ramlibacter sp.]|nr:gamma-glutamyl-gamma-aminobutyrate hydrolase family protein [Ramlibacter sp.]
MNQETRLKNDLVKFARERRSQVTEIVYVGVTFRTDGSGKAHLEHDCAAILAMNQMLNKEGGRLFPFTIRPVTLPRGAGGPDTPTRRPDWTDLDDIHLLYIPGAPTANDTQEGSSLAPELNEEERDLNRQIMPVQKPKEKGPAFQQRMDKYLRIQGEHVSRAAYELRLLGIARARGIPVLAVCAGSWRLLESYGGKVRTLAIEPRGSHKAVKPGDTWKLEHQLQLLGGRNLVKLMLTKRHEHLVKNRAPTIKLTSVEGQTTTLVEPHVVLSGVNTTHWAVASTQRAPRITLTTPEGVTTTLVEQGPHQLSPGTGSPSDWLEITAMDPDTDTVEAFEALYGAPTLGIQWHPECYLPGMPGEGSGSDAVQALSKTLFELMGVSALTVKRRQDVIKSLTLEGKAFDMLCDSARAMALQKMVEAGNFYIGACSTLPTHLWSPRMLAVSQAIDILGDYCKEVIAGKMVGAAFLFRDAKSILNGYGVSI